MKSFMKKSGISVHNLYHLLALIRRIHPNSPLTVDSPPLKRQYFHFNEILVVAYSGGLLGTDDMTIVADEVVDNSDVVGASAVGAAPTTSSFST